MQWFASLLISSLFSNESPEKESSVFFSLVNRLSAIPIPHSRTYESYVPIWYNLTSQIWFAAWHLYPTTGINPAALTAWSCRAGGAMALLMSRWDKNQMQLLSHWHSDCMFQYLHQEAEPVLQRLAQRMFNNGNYYFLPTAMVPLL